MRSPKSLASPRRPKRTAMGRLHNYLRRHCRGRIFTVKLACLIHSVWKEGFDDGVAMQEHGERVFGHRQLARWRKEREAK